MQKTTVISSNHKFSLDIHELLRFRDLFLVLAQRDIRVRYAQTYLGILWALFQPLTILLIFTVIFAKGIQVDSGGLPYPVFALAGLVPWTYFSFVMTQSGASIINAQDMVKKIYFPRIIIPLSKAAVGFVDYSISFLLLLLLLVYYAVMPSANLVYLPMFVILGIVASVGIGVWISALTVRYRDFQHVVPFIAQVGLYASPVAYTSNIIPEKYQWAYYLNPVSGIIDGYRWSLFGFPYSNWAWISIVMTLLIFGTGIVYFKKVERIIADIV